jgi:hypothetical protein
MFLLVYIDSLLGIAARPFFIIYSSLLYFYFPLALFLSKIGFMYFFYSFLKMFDAYLFG